MEEIFSIKWQILKFSFDVSLERDFNPACLSCAMAIAKVLEEQHTVRFIVLICCFDTLQISATEEDAVCCEDDNSCGRVLGI